MEIEEFQKRSYNDQIARPFRARTSSKTWRNPVHWYAGVIT